MTTAPPGPLRSRPPPTSDLARVCLGGAATNAPSFDAKSAKGLGALNTEKQPNYSGNLSVGPNEKWGIDVPDWAEANFIVCVEGEPSASVKPRKCKASEEKDKGRFDFVQFDYELTVREVATGEVLTELETLTPEFDSCPMFAFLDEDRVYTPTPTPPRSATGSTRGSPRRAARSDQCVLNGV
ncbi:hypothetical protein [Nocardioides alcanivorans]|uniref:hypothetical protein n=1 Tax=Nocardioides alcanivorans TaxID=2897352 RepID=UPI001F1C924B|nr:hypothetical protein [Nocardioides alcanivorans]